MENEVSIAYWEQRLREANKAVEYAAGQLAVAKMLDFGWDSLGCYLERE